MLIYSVSCNLTKNYKHMCKSINFHNYRNWPFYTERVWGEKDYKNKLKFTNRTSSHWYEIGL